MLNTERVDLVAILEACHSHSADMNAWLNRVVDTARPLLDRGLGVGFGFVEDATRAQGPLMSVYRGEFGNMFRFMAENLVGELSDAGYRTLWHPTTPVVLMSRLVRLMGEADLRAMGRMQGKVTLVDAVAILGSPRPGTSFVLASPAPAAALVTPATRRTLTRVVLHVECALRLRGQELEPVAIIDPTGRLLDLQATDREDELRSSITDRAKGIEYLRARRHRKDGERALASWKALIDGRWSLSEHVDTDGKRTYWAFENAPDVQARRNLTKAEVSVLEFALRGITGKHAAYAMGKSQAFVSECLSSAGHKLGVRTRTDLLRLAAGLLAEPLPPGASSTMTSAESNVLDLVRQGLSNAAIAKHRGTSKRTVANQVAALLRKSGRPSRRALLVSAEQTAGTWDAIE